VIRAAYGTGVLSAQREQRAASSQAEPGGRRQAAVGRAGKSEEPLGSEWEERGGRAQ
jgi:hypothetical protein